MKRFCIGFLITLVLLFKYNKKQISNFTINKVDIQSHKINKVIKITQISDFHSNKYINLDKLYNDIFEFNPDLIFLTGDMIDSKTKDLKITMDLYKKIVKLNKDTFYILGNHETNHILWEELAQNIKDLGIQVLNNDSIDIILNNHEINISGISFSPSSIEYNKSIENMDKDKLNILLAHSPSKAINYYTGIEDIIFSGHTHGGQVRLPGMGAIIAPGQGFLPEYDKGIIDLGETTLYIDSGLGNSLLPIRALNPVQISNIKITPMHP